MTKNCTNESIFKNLKSRYSQQQMGSVTQLLRTSGKLLNPRLSNDFHRDCIAEKVAPRFIQSRIKRSACKYSPVLEKAFMTDEINRQNNVINKMQTTYDGLLVLVKKILSDQEVSRLLKVIDSVNARREKDKKIKHRTTIALLQWHRF